MTRFAQASVKVKQYIQKLTEKRMIIRSQRSGPKTFLAQGSAAEDMEERESAAFRILDTSQSVIIVTLRYLIYLIDSIVYSIIS